MSNEARLLSRIPGIAVAVAIENWEETSGVELKEALLPCRTDSIGIKSALAASDADSEFSPRALTS